MRDTARIEHIGTQGGIEPFDLLLIEVDRGGMVVLDSLRSSTVVKIFEPTPQLMAALRKALGPPPKAADWAPCGSERCALGDDCPCYTAGVADNR